MSQAQTKIVKSVGGLHCAAVSDVGMRRANNQDSLAVSLAENEELWTSRGHLFVVADGMGAHAAGELASKIATDNIPLTYQKRRDLSPCASLVEAVQDANKRINTKGQNSVDFQGMGTTCSSLAILPGGAVAAHVGDSRVYRLRGEYFEQLTFDHSLVWEMAAAGQATEEEVPAYVPKNVITRSLGPNSEVKVDIEGPFPLESGDRFLLCSDGLTGPLNSQLIGLILGSLPADEAAQTLVDLANLLGGPDNITVIVAAIDNVAQLGGATFEDENCNPPTSSGVPSGKRKSMALTAGLVGALAAGGLVIAGKHLFGTLTAAVAAIAAGLLAFLPKQEPTASAKLPGPQGKAPYRRYEASASAEGIEPLTDIVRQLEDLESQRDWEFDWSDIHADRAEAHQAIAKGNPSGAVVAYSRAVRRLMQAVRDSSPEPPSDSSINLGVD